MYGVPLIILSSVVYNYMFFNEKCLVLLFLDGMHCLPIKLL